MNQGRIVHFEDDSNFRETIAAGLDIFSDGRHQVVGGAGDLAGALAVVDQIHLGDIDANVVLLDGNLSPGLGGSDARVISGQIKSLGLAVRVIGASSSSMEDNGVEVDVDVPKMIGFRPNLTAQKLIETIDSLEEPARTN